MGVCTSFPCLFCPHLLSVLVGIRLSSEVSLAHCVPQARGLEPEAWANLPGQGLRYLEHLCLVLEQMASLQQLCLQLQTRRPVGVSEPGAGRPADRQVMGGGGQRRDGTPGTRAPFRTASALWSGPQVPGSPVRRTLKRKRSRPWFLHLHPLVLQAVRGPGCSARWRQVRGSWHLPPCPAACSGPTGRTPEPWA